MMVAELQLCRPTEHEAEHQLAVVTGKFNDRRSSGLDYSRVGQTGRCVADRRLLRFTAVHRHPWGLFRHMTKETLAAERTI